MMEADLPANLSHIYILQVPCLIRFNHTLPAFNKPQNLCVSEIDVSNCRDELVILVRSHDCLLFVVLMLAAVNIHPPILLRYTDVAEL